MVSSAPLPTLTPSWGARVASVSPAPLPRERQVLNLRELASKSCDELGAILGAHNGKLLHDFLHREA